VIVDDLNIPDEQRGRQAVASLGGYAHQIFTTLLAWMRIASDETLLVEVAEDYAIITADALTMTQVKRETSATTLTLRREDARKAILSLWQFGEANPGRDVRLHFLTTTSAGQERGVPFPGGVSGIAYWARAAIGEDVGPLRQFLLGLDWPPDFAVFLAEADEDTFRSRLLRRLVWLTGAEPTEVALDTLSARLELLAIERGLLPSDGARVLPQLLLDLLQVVLRDDRRLDRLDFERAWERATTVPVPLSAARLLSGTVPSIGPDYGEFALDPLPQRLSPRSETVDRLAGISRSGAVPWIHGSSGLGKSRLATLLAARSGGLWHVVRLRGLPSAEIRQTLRRAVGALDRSGLAGVVLDDLPIPLVEPWRRFIRTVATEAARLGLSLVVTSERAPLAPAIDEFAPWRLEPVAAPYLDLDEVSEIVTAAGGDAKTWAQIVHLTCGGGHPLFVDARIAGLASRAWPREERLAGLLDDGRVGELDDVRASVALRLLDELDPDTHTLLLRLSILVGMFDRNLVMAVAEAHRPLLRPGVLLDFLIGPWIESAGTDGLKLSPLLGSAGTQGLGEAERNAVRNAVVDHLVARKPLNAKFLSQLLIQALAARNMRGFMFIAGAVLTADNRRAVAAACMPLAFLTSKDGRLVPENPGLSASLRLAQVVAVTAEPLHAALPKVLDEADAEFARMPEPIRSGSKFTMLLAVLAAEETNIAPHVWLPRLLEYIAMTEEGLVPSELTEGMGRPDMGGLTEDQFFFMLRTNGLDDLDQLEELFRLLADIDPTRRRSWFAAATTLLGGPPLFIQSVWSRLAMAGKLDAAAAVGAYRRLAVLAEGWQESIAAVECHRAAAILLDEYLNDREGALDQLNAAAALHPSDRGLARTRAGVLAHAGRHEEASKVLAELLPDYSVEEPLERSLMLQAAAISSAKTGAHRKAAALFLQAHSASEGVTSLEPGIRVGLLCDAAVEFGAVEDWPAALAALAEAHLDAEALVGDGSDRSWIAIQAVSQVAQWLNASQEGRPALALQDHPGTWSLLNPTIPEDRTGAVKLDTGLMNAALLEVRLGSSTTLCTRFSDRERDGLVTPLSSLALRGGQLAAAIDRREATDFMAILPNFVAAAKVVVEAKAAGSLDVATPIAPAPFAEWSEVELQSARQAASELVAELMLDGDPVATQAAADQLLTLGMGLDRLLSAEDSDDDYTTLALNALGWLLRPGIPDPASLVHASISLMQWLTVCSRPSLRARAWTEVSKAWREVTGRISDARADDTVESLAALLDAGAGTTAELARIVLVGARTAGVKLHPTTEAMLVSKAEG
jgi:hypothetical protein